MKYSPVDEVVAACYSTIKGAKREHRPLMLFWIWLAEKQIGCSKPTLKTEEIDVEDLTVRKPKDHLSTDELSLVDNEGNDRTYTYHGYKKRIHSESAYNSTRNIDVYEDAFSIYLSSDATYIDRIKISYWAHPVDANCDPLIPEDHIYAIMQFVRYNFYLREEASQAAIAEAKTEWKIQAAKARGKNKMPDIPEARQIMKSWMSLIPKNSGLDYDTY